MHQWMFRACRTDHWCQHVLASRVALTTALEVKDGKTVRKLLKGEAGLTGLQNADPCHGDVWMYSCFAQHDQPQNE